MDMLFLNKILFFVGDKKFREGRVGTGIEFYDSRMILPCYFKIYVGYFF